jgi:hypothetical protein
MASIEKLAVSGIRSFDDKQRETIVISLALLANLKGVFLAIDAYCWAKW